MYLPCNGNSGIEIIQLGGTQRDLFVLFSVSRLDFQLRQLILQSFQLFLLFFICPVKAINSYIRARYKNTRYIKPVFPNFFNRIKKNKLYNKLNVSGVCHKTIYTSK